MGELQWKKVTEFQLGWTGAAKSSILFLKFADGSETDLACNSILELQALGELLRSGKHIEYSSETQDFRLAWEAAGYSETD